MSRKIENYDSNYAENLMRKCTGFHCDRRTFYQLRSKISSGNCSNLCRGNPRAFGTVNFPVRSLKHIAQPHNEVTTVKYVLEMMCLDCLQNVITFSENFPIFKPQQLQRACVWRNFYQFQTFAVIPEVPFFNAKLVQVYQNKCKSRN